MKTIATRYLDDDTLDTFVEVENSGDGQVDVHLSPRTDDTQTFSMTPDQAWNLARDLARAATYAEES